VEPATELPEIPANVAKLAADEIDYLRLVFRDRYGFDVLTIPQARSIAEMFGECGSEPDFHRRVAALADLLGRFAPWNALADTERVDESGGRVGPLVALERLIQRDYPEAVGHVQTLRLIPKARIMFPTHSRTSEAISVMRGLGVDYPATDWQVAWLEVLTAFWASLAAVRGAIQGGAPVSEMTTSG